MVASLTYRTSDGTRWGGGFGADLSATQIDLNFWTLFSAVQDLEDAPGAGAGIDFINQPAEGNIFYVHLTDHRVLGPFFIPTANWNPRGEWTPNTAYAAYDVVYYNGSVYLIVVPHTSGAVFSPFSTDGMGHLLYNLLLQQPANALPPDGTEGMRLVKASGSPYVTRWEYDLIRITFFCAGQPLPTELLFQYPVVSNMDWPAGLIGSVVFARQGASAETTYTLLKNGAEIGTITFAASPSDVATIDFPDIISFVPGDIVDLIGPFTPDATQSDISFSIVGTLTAQ